MVAVNMYCSFHFGGASPMTEAAAVISFADV